MDFDGYLGALRREGEWFQTAISTGDLDAAVPTCPGWTLRELAHHVGRVHHFAAGNISAARPTPLSEEELEAQWGPMPVDSEAAAWYRAALARLLATLRAAPEDLAAWTFLPNTPTPRLFWARRQAHELAVHRFDAQLAGGQADPVPSTFGLDGIDELLFGFFARRGRLRSATPRTLAIHADDARWLVHIGEERAVAQRGDAPAECTVAGTASDVYFALWNRLPLRDFHTAGDHAVVDLWVANAQVRWS